MSMTKYLVGIQGIRQKSENINIGADAGDKFTSPSTVKDNGKRIGIRGKRWIAVRG